MLGLGTAVLATSQSTGTGATNTTTNCRVAAGFSLEASTLKSTAQRSRIEPDSLHFTVTWQADHELYSHHRVLALAGVVLYKNVFLFMICIICFYI